MFAKLTMMADGSDVYVNPAQVKCFCLPNDDNGTGLCFEVGSAVVMNVKEDLQTVKTSLENAWREQRIGSGKEIDFDKYSALMDSMLEDCKQHIEHLKAGRLSTPHDPANKGDL